MTCRRARPQWPLEIMPDRPANCLPGNASAMRKDQFLRPLFDLFLTAFFHHGHVLVKSNHTMLKNKPYYQPYNLYQAQANPSCRRLSFLAPRVLRKPLVSCPGFYNTPRFPCKRFHGGMSNRSAIGGECNPYEEAPFRLYHALHFGFTPKTAANLAGSALGRRS